MPPVRKRQKKNHLFSNTESTKLLCNNEKVINCFENLSNEIIYDIFDYLGGCEIYKAFSNLNNRFQYLLVDRSFFIKIQISFESISALERNVEQFIYPNRHRIISLHFNNEFLMNQFFMLCTIGASFSNLRSLFLFEISTFKLAVLLFYLKSLPRLSSMTIFFDYCDDDLGDIYQMIFSLPYLKYLKVEVPDHQVDNITLPMATGEQYSALEYLAILHDCTLNQFADILSYTPQLTHLYCFSIFSSDFYEYDVFTRLNNLVHLTLSVQEFTFNQFEQFIVNISSQLRLLSVAFQCTDENYLDGARWERLITKYMPYLNIFIFSYTDHINKDLQITSSHGLVNHFLGPFYLEKQWIFRVLIKNDEIHYLLRPYADNMYDFQEYIHFERKSSIDYYQGVNVNIEKIVSLRKNPIFIKKISPLLQLLNVSRLVIECCPMSMNTFIKILTLLPNIDLLRITLLASADEFLAREKDMKSLRRVLKKTKIRKLTLRNPSSSEEISFILDLFRRIESFAIQKSSNIDLLAIVEHTLRKMKENKMRHPMTFCIMVVEGTNDKLDQLHKMIKSKKLLKNYTISRQREKFYLQWKKQ